MNSIKQIFMNKIGFLKWAELHPDDVIHLTGITNARVFLSPDVHSLHMIWQTGIEHDDIDIQHEIQDYSSYPNDTCAEFLEWHLFDDCYGSITEDTGIIDIYEAISDFKEWTRSTTPIIRLKDLNQ